MSNSRPPSRMQPDERRDQIVRVAAASFAEVGYARTSMSRIATEAGVTRALVYHYFAGKETLLEAVLHREGEALLEATAPVAGLTPRENLARALDGYLERFAASSGALRELYTPHAAAPAVVWEIAAANHDVQVARLVGSLGLRETPVLRLALGAWLAFVEQAARGLAESAVDRGAVVRLCTEALGAVTDVSLDPDDPPPSPAPTGPGA